MAILRSMLLILVILTGQIGVCSSVYVMPNGKECPTCSNKSCNPEVATICETGHQFAVMHRDCRECCKLTTRGSSDRHEATAMTAGPSMDIALTDDVQLFCLRAMPRGAVVIARIIGNPPTGPPSQRSSRAPPRSMLA